MRASSLFTLLASGLASTQAVQAVTIYTTFTTNADGSPIKPSNTNTAVGPAYSGFTAYNMTTLTPPPLPSNMPQLNFPIQLYAGGMANLSIPLKGSFFGFSIELSVANQFLGRNSSRLNVPFLNYVANIRARIGGPPTIRVGGNSQENTQLFLSPFPNYEIINKTDDTNPLNPTVTPEVNVDIDLLYTMNNISALVDANWYLGLPFAYPLNITGISEMTAIFEEVLGDRLIALQMGNEPDLYGQQHRKRPFDYWIPQYLDEWNQVIPNILNNSAIKRQQIMLAPSICCNIPGNWSIQNLLDAGFVQSFDKNLAQLAVQHYPHDNCPGDNPPSAQTIYPDYLLHSSQIRNAGGFLSASAEAVAANKPFIMFETNTASCSGFSGLSDSFGAALWAIDWSLQLAYSNFTSALFHFGGQMAAYNAFTPPPSNYSEIYQWTTGAIYYSNLLVAEALGSSNVSQVVDLKLNNGADQTPGYAIYENGTPTRVVLINFMDDGGSGTAAYTGYVHIGGVNGLPDTSPQTVTVRYLAAPSVSEKFNITWAGQTLGGQFLSDGILRGDVVTETVQCAADTGCPIKVPAPGAALVFLSTQAQSESYNSALSATYPTTYYKHGASPIDQAVLETSNGRGGPAQAQFPIGSTSHGSDLRAAAMRKVAPVGLSLLAVAGGAMFVGRMLIR